MGKKSKRRVAKKPQQLPASEKTQAVMAAAKQLIVAGDGKEKRNNNSAAAAEDDHDGARGTMDYIIEIVTNKFDNDKANPVRMYSFFAYMQYMEHLNLGGGKDAHAFDSDMTEADKNFLKKIIRASDEPAFFRAQALKLMGLFHHFTENDIDEGHRCLKNAISVCRTATEVEKGQPVPFLGELMLGFRHKTVGDILQAVQEFLGLLLDGFSNMGAFVKWDEQRQAIVEYHPIPGHQCDYCGKQKQDGDDGEEMGVCQRCTSTYYCSLQCQREHWKQHKQVCRKKGEFQLGDQVRTLKAYGSIPVGAIVTIVAVKEDPATSPHQSRWITGYGDVPSETEIGDNMFAVVKKKSSAIRNSTGSLKHHSDGTPKRFCVSYDDSDENGVERAILTSDDLRNYRSGMWDVNSPKTLSVIQALSNTKSNEEGESSHEEDESNAAILGGDN